MSQQEKIGLAMEMFLDKTAYAAGNYAKENETLAGSLATAKSAFTNFLSGSGDVSSLVSSFSNLANVVVNSLTEIAPRLTQGISDLVQQVVPLIPPLLNTLLPVLIEGATTLINGLVSALPAVIATIVDVLPMLIEGIMSIVDALIGALPQIMQTLVAALPTLIPQLIDATVSLMMMLVEMLPQIIQPLIAALPEIIVSIVEALVGNLPALIQGAIQLIMGIVAALPQIIQALVAALPQIISLIIQAVLGNLPAIIAGLVQVTVGIVAALPQILGSLIMAIPAALSGIWDGIKNVFSGLGEWFGEKFSAAKEAAANAWSDAKEKWSGIKEKAVSGFNDLKNKVSTKFNEAKKAAEEKWSDAKEKWSGIKEKVVSGFSDLKNSIGNKFNEAKTNAIQKWNDIKSKFSTVKSNVVNAFSDLGGKLSPLFSKAKDNATKTWSNVKSIFNKFKNGDIVGAFSDLGSLLKGKFSSALNTAKKGFDKIKQIGKDLVTGLWNGINDKFSWLTSKIKGFASNVTDKLKSFFGIHSPSTVMRDEVGRYLAQGVVEGILGGLPLVEDAAKETKDTLLESMSDTESFEKVGSQAANGFAKTFEERLEEAGKSSMQEVAEEGAYALVRFLTDSAEEAGAILNAIENTEQKSVINFQEVRKKVTAGVYELVDKNVSVVKDGAQVLRQQQKAAAEDTIKTTEKTSDEVSKKLLDAAQKKLDTFKTYNNMTLAEEVGFWDEIRVQCKDGSDERIQADQKYFDAKKAFNEKLIAAEEALQSSLDATEEKIESHADSIMDTFGLFDSFEFGDFVGANTLMDNLDSQLDALELYDKQMSQLREKIGDTALYDKLESMGVNSLSEIMTINSMTEMQLQSYVDKYSQLAEKSRSIAEDELAEETLSATQEALQTFADACGVAGIEIVEETSGMMNVVIHALQQLESAFENFKPNMKLPHLSMSGSFDFQTGEAPSFDIEWYKKAMNSAMILNKPTIFGYNAESGKYMGGGEAGSEVVSGTTTLINMIQNAVATQNDALAYYLQKILDVVATFFPQQIEAFRNMKLCLDTGTVVGELAVPMDEALGRLSSRKERGR